MLFGALLPKRLGERFNGDGTSKYGAITHVYYFGRWAFITGLVDCPKRSHVNELALDLYHEGVRRMHYYSKGEMVIWDLYKTERGYVRGKPCQDSRKTKR